MQITTLIPAYKPQYLVEQLTALRRQTVKPARIIFSDDSPDQAFVAALNSEPIKGAVADLNIEVWPGLRIGGYNNFRRLLQIYGGKTELFHLLLDDDIPYPSFYERHLHAHRQRVSHCVVSRRWTATEVGLPTHDLPVPPAVNLHPLRMLSLDSEMLFAQTAGLSCNWLGEFSNATFRAEMVAGLDDASMADISFAGLEDLGGFLKASLQSPLGYINDHLGYFRTSAQQNSANPMGRPMKLAHLGYIALTLAGQRLGQLSAEAAASNLAMLGPTIMHRYGHEADLAELCATLPALARGGAEAETQFLVNWRAYVGEGDRQLLPALPPQQPAARPASAPA